MQGTVRADQAAISELFAADEQALLPVLPLLYVAWADAELTEAELGAIRTRLAGLGVSDAAIARWLDPEAPPSAEQLRGLLQRLRRAGRQLPDEARRSLADLGLALAREAAGEDFEGHAEVDALRALESELGLYGVSPLGDIVAAPVAGDAPEQAPPAPPVEALARLLDEPFPEDRAAVRRLLAHPDLRHVEGDLPKEAYRERVLSWAHRVADADIARKAFPETAPEGPAAANVGRFVAAFETLGAFDLSLLVKSGVQFGLFGGSIFFLGDAAQRARYLPQVTSLALPGCFAMTELGHGSNVRELGTIARYLPEAGCFEVHTPDESARKEWIGNAAAHGRLATVFAQLEVDGEGHGVHALLVPIRDEQGQPLPGVRIEDCGHKQGLNGVDNGRLWFDRVRVPRENLLGRFGRVTAEGRYESPIASPSRRFFTMLGTLVGGRVSVGAASLTVGRSALAIALGYAARRRQFGPATGQEVTLLRYPSHRRRLLPRLAENIALSLTSQALQRRYAAWVATVHNQPAEEGAGDAEGRAIEGLAAGVKAIASWHARDTAQEARECCGGQGYATRNRLAALKADSEIFTTFEGDNTVLLQLVARGLLTGFKAQFEDNRLLGMARHLAHLAGISVAERNPVVVRRTDPEHLRDPEYQGDLLRARRDDLLNSAAQRLRSRLSRGVPGFTAFLEVQTHLLLLARAEIEAQTIEAICAAEQRAEPALAAELARLRSLWFLWRVEQDQGWYFEHGYLTTPKLRAVRNEVDALCLELAAPAGPEGRPRALWLVDAFQLPATALAAPIAFASGAP